VSAEIPSCEFGPVSPEKMKTMAALLRDPNPIHWDAGVVRELGLGDRPVNQGPINMSFLVNMLAWWTGDPGALRELVIRYQDNVVAGDVVRCAASVESEEDGLIRCNVTASVGARPVITGTATVSRRR